MPEGGISPLIAACFAKWRHSDRAERANKDVFLIEGCEARGLSRPDPQVETAEREHQGLDQYHLGQFRPVQEALGRNLLDLALQLESTATRLSLPKSRTPLMKRVIPALLHLERE